MQLLERGYDCLRFCPAEPAGGVAYLRALAAPLPASVVAAEHGQAITKLAAAAAGLRPGPATNR